MPDIHVTIEADRKTQFPESFPVTHTQYGYDRTTHPAHAAYRGDLRLAHQPQQVRRDLTGERLLGMMYDKRDSTIHVTVLRSNEDRRKHAGYRYILTTYGGTSYTAFRSRAGFRAFCAAYGLWVNYRHHGKNIICGDIDVSRMGPWQPLNCRPIPSDDPHGYNQ